MAKHATLMTILVMPFWSVLKNACATRILMYLEIGQVAVIEQLSDFKSSAALVASMLLPIITADLAIKSI